MSVFASAPTLGADVPSALELLQKLNSLEARDRVPLEHRSSISRSPNACRSILILHGLYESPWYLKGINRYFLKRGFNVVNILLSGHFRAGDPRMLNVTFKDWIRDAELGLKIAASFRRPVFVFGYSTGGTMAADLALRFPQQIAGLFLFAPALELTWRTDSLVRVGSAIGFFPSESCTAPPFGVLCEAAANLGAGGIENALPLLKEGLAWSPFGGSQVREYINWIYSWWLSGTEIGEPVRQQQYHYFDRVGVYAQIQTPVFLALAHDDLTISASFAKDVYRKLSGLKDLQEYSAFDSITHTNIIKYSDDAYAHSRDFYNHYTVGLEDRMDRFLTKIERQSERQTGRSSENRCE